MAKFQLILQFPDWRRGAWNLGIQYNCNMVLGKKTNAMYFLEDVLTGLSPSQHGKDWLQSSHKPMAWGKEEGQTQQSLHFCLITRILQNLTSKLLLPHNSTSHHLSFTGQKCSVSLDSATGFFAQKQLKVRKLKDSLEAELVSSACWSCTPVMEPKFDINTRESFKEWCRTEGDDKVWRG